MIKFGILRFTVSTDPGLNKFILELQPTLPNLKTLPEAFLI